MSRSISTPDLYRVSMSRLDIKGIDEELLEVCMLSGIKIDPDVFKILLDLMKMNVSPTALVQILRRVATSKGLRDEPRTAKSQGPTPVPSGILLERERDGISNGTVASLPKAEAMALRLKELKQQIGH